MRAKLLLTVLLSLCVFSCRKNDDTIIEGRGDAIRCFTASFLDEDSKTYLADENLGDVYWSKPDSICIFSASGNGDLFISASGGKTAQFTGQTASSQSYFGLYPFSSSAVYDGTAVSTVLPSVQAAKAGTFSPRSFIAIGQSNKTSMGFKNACGGLRFTVESSGYTSVEFAGNNNEAIAGNVSVKGSVPSITVTGNAQKTIKLVCKDGFVPGKYYYISMVPQVFSKGFTMKFSGSKTISGVCSSPVEIRRSIFCSVKNADNEKTLPSIQDGVDLSEGGIKVANCYVVSKKGTFKIPIVRGNNSANILSDVSKVSVLWETVNTATAPSVGTVISSVSQKNNYLYFTTTGTNGNALLAASDKSGNVLWSWHIWACNGYDKDATAQTLVGSNKVMLDRNIGALSATTSDPMSNGLMYQWGRKDPFMGATSLSVNALMVSTNPSSYEVVNESIGTVAYVIAHPNVYIQAPTSITQAQDWHYDGRDNSLWMSSKTIYDPCPYGWKVPSDKDSNDSPWIAAKYGTMTNGAYFECSAGNAWYPANGFLAYDGKLYQSGQFALYWTTTGNTQFVNTLQIYLKKGSEKVYPASGGHIRAEGHSIRCTKE